MSSPTSSSFSVTTGQPARRLPLNIPGVDLLVREFGSITLQCNYHRFVNQTLTPLIDSLSQTCSSVQERIIRSVQNPFQPAEEESFQESSLLEAVYEQVLR